VLKPPAAREILADVRPDIAQAQHQHAGAGQVGRQPLHQLQRGVGSRSGPVAEAGFLLHALVGEKHAVQQAVQEGAGCVCLHAPLVGRFHLVADLLVAHHLRLQAHGYFKQVLHAQRRAVDAVEIASQIAALAPAFPRRQLADNGRAAISGGAVGYLRAVTGAEHQHVAQAERLAQGVQQLPDGERRLFVGQANDLKALVH